MEPIWPVLCSLSRLWHRAAVSCQEVEKGDHSGLIKPLLEVVTLLGPPLDGSPLCKRSMT
jgi:hypothetical protein